MSDNHGIPADDLLVLIRQLRRPSPPPIIPSPDLARYLKGVDQGRGQAANAIESLLEEYGIAIESEASV